MSQYGIIYRLEFKNIEGFTVRVNISPTDILIDDGDTPEVIALTGADQPLVISVSNNEQEKFAPIRSKVAKITFVTNSNSGLDSSTFSQGGDDLWKVDIYLQDTPELIFTGFLIMADNQQPFQPDPQYCTLTATDQLGTIKDIPLVDSDGNNPIGKYRVADLVAMCLNKTGLALNINIVNNLKPGGGQLVNLATFSFVGNYVVTDNLVTAFFYPGQEVTIAGTATHDGTYNVDYVVQSPLITEVHFLETITAPGEGALTTFTDTSSAAHWMDSVYIDVKTFEAEIGVSEDCQTILKKILGEDCYIVQYKGEWWIYRIDEINDLPVYVATFDSDGAYVSTAAGTQYDISIGAAESFKFANADTLLRFIRPHGWIKETFNYNSPEIPCNSDFSRGEFVDDLPDEVVGNDTLTAKKYNLDCWVLLQDVLPPTSPLPADVAEAYIKKLTDFAGYEKESYAVVTYNTTGAASRLTSQPIPIDIQDKFTLSYSFRWSTNEASAGTGLSTNSVRLDGNDGSIWFLDDDGKWYLSDATWSVNRKTVVNTWATATVDETEWRTFELLVDPEGCPTSGVLTISIFWGSSITPTDRDLYISDLQFNYIPFINGSYNNFSGQYNRVDRLETGYKAKQDNEVFISDSPKPIFKGGMFLTSPADLYVGSVSFADGASVAVLSGNYTGLFSIGMIIVITGTASNNITAKILEVDYSIVGDQTGLVLSVPTVSEIAVTATFQYLTYHLFPVWYNSQPFATGYPTDSTYLHPYGYIQAFSVWNQFKGVNDPINGRGLGLNIFGGAVVGLTDDWPDMIHRFILTDSNVQTNDRYFMLISMEQNWRTCIWIATLVEVFNSAVGKTYGDTFEFKFIPA